MKEITLKLRWENKRLKEEIPIPMERNIDKEQAFSAAMKKKIFQTYYLYVRIISEDKQILQSLRGSLHSAIKMIKVIKMIYIILITLIKK